MHSDCLTVLAMLFSSIAVGYCFTALLALCANSVRRRTFPNQYQWGKQEKQEKQQNGEHLFDQLEKGNCRRTQDNQMDMDNLGHTERLQFLQTRKDMVLAYLGLAWFGELDLTNLYVQNMTMDKAEKVARNDPRFTKKQALQRLRTSLGGNFEYLYDEGMSVQEADDAIRQARQQITLHYLMYAYKGAPDLQRLYYPGMTPGEAKQAVGLYLSLSQSDMQV